MNIATAPYYKKVRKRTKIFTVVLVLWTFGIFLRLLQLQVFSHARMSAQVLVQNQAKIDIFPQRGAIHDRKGSILAQSVPSLTVYYTPAAGEPLDLRMKPILKLQPVLELSSKDIERVKTALQNGSSHIPVKRKLELETAEVIKGLGLNGIYTREEAKRLYPQGPLASHILGSVSVDNKGQGGVEHKFDSILSGKKGKQIVFLDARRREYHFETIEEPQRGGGLVLTIDATIQYIAQKELERAVQEHSADWGTVIISNPASGEILAMASWPTFDPNSYPPESKEAEPNRAIHHLFDPGSTFKIVTASAALESRWVPMTETFDCSKGSIETAGTPIRDHKNFGVLTFPDVISHSSNVGVIQIGRRVGPKALYQTIKTFQFGTKTGIELPAEAAGKVWPLENWTKRSLDSVSIGYEISVTALQMLQAMNVIANRGILVPPRIVKDIQGVPMTQKRSGSEPRQIISEETARNLVSILEKAVLEGTGQEALAKGYTVAGKTGTTQKFDPALKSYSSSKHIALFVGFVPVENPQLSMIVVLDEPKTDEYYGGQVAAPVFREIARRVLRYLNIYPDTGSNRTIIAANMGRKNRP
jgi:cell division protein FtsI (penicillin-binding protein 3)